MELSNIACHDVNNDQWKASNSYCCDSTVICSRGSLAATLTVVVSFAWLFQTVSKIVILAIDYTRITLIIDRSEDIIVFIQRV